MGLSVNLPEASGKTDVAVTGPCTVNGVDVSSGFSNNGGGSYSISYIVGASDTERAAGTVPISCVLGDAGGNVTISSVAANTLAIDTNDDGTIGSGTTTGATLPSFSSVTLSPSSGTLVAGNTATVTFNEAASQTDLAVTGSCMVNAVDVAPSFHSTGGGQYVATYTVASGDGERPAGHIPFTCTLGNSAGDVSVHGWSDGNTLAIDTNGDGTIDNGTSTLGFTVSADPSTGMLDVGDQLVVSMQDPLPSGDVVIGSNGCRVNDVDVAPTYTYMGNGLYRVTYTVAAGNALRPAGGIPFDCTLQNSTGSVHLVAFTDGNTVGVNETTGGGGGTGTTTGTSTLSFAVSAVPMSGTIDAGHDLEVYMNESSHDLHIALDGACTVNGVDVSSSFQNLTDGLYKVIYHVGSTDTARAAGTVPISCSVHDTETGDATVISAFTDSNTVAIGGTTGGGTGTTTGGTIGGDVTGGGSASSTVALHVDSIEQIRDTATAGGGYANGWVWVFHITVPTDETSLAMKFDDWTRNGGGDSIAAADDMRISSDQAASTSPVSITAAGTYSTDLSLTGDTDPSTPGRQIEVKVEMQVPSDTMNGTYTTAYGVRSM
jgi:methionine-rich copper-binding protein CopC